MSVELKEGEWYIDDRNEIVGPAHWCPENCSGNDPYLWCLGDSHCVDGWYTSNGKRETDSDGNGGWIVAHLPRSDPRHPEHESGEIVDPLDPTDPRRWDQGEPPPKLRDLAGCWNGGWRRYCPSDDEVGDGEVVIYSYRREPGAAPWRGCDVGREVRKWWSAAVGGIYAWMPLPAPASPPYSPPRGWVRFDEREPCEADGDDKDNVLVEYDDGYLHLLSVEYLQGFPNGQRVRWCRTKWVREATA